MSISLYRTTILQEQKWIAKGRQEINAGNPDDSSRDS